MKQFLYKYWGVILIATLIATIIVLLLMNSRQKTQIANLKGENKYLTQTIDTFRDKNGRLIAEQEVAIYESNKRVKELSDEIFELKGKNSRLVKQVNSFGQIGQNTKIDSVFIAYTDTLYVDTFGQGYIAIPRKFSIVDTNYQIAGTVLKTGVSLDNIEIPNTVSYREIEQRQGWFKPTVTVVQVHNSNPFVHTTGMTSITVKEKPSAWNRWVKPTLTAIGAGIITYQIVK